MNQHIIRYASLLVAILLLVALTPFRTSVSAAPANSDSTSREVVVRLEANVSVIPFAAQNGLDYRSTAIEQIEGTTIYRLKITDGSSPAQKVVALQEKGIGRVVYAEPNAIGKVAESVARSSWAKGEDEGHYQNQWAAAKLRLPEAHLRSRGAGVTVAILDTGVDMAHPLLASRLAPGYDFVDSDADPSEEGVYGTDIAYGHGTHVAGLVLLAAPDATILPLRVLKPDGTGSNWAIIQALQYAHSHHAAVINLSYAVAGRSKAIDDLLKLYTCGTPADADCSSSAFPGAVVTAAAGNSGTPRREYPAATASAGVIAVAASTEADTIASFSTAGSWVPIAAPGEHITSSVPLNSGSAYGTWSGTSMAAPLTAGVAALIRATHPDLTPAQVAQRLIASAHPISGRVEQRLDAAEALADAQ